MQPDVVGKSIKRSRQARGMSQRELASTAGLPQSMLSQIESGARRGSTMQLCAAQRLAFALGVSLDAIAGIPGDMPRHVEDTDSESLAAVEV